MTPAIFSLSGLTLTADERALFRDASPAGYILFGRNIADRAQLRALTDELRALHGRDNLLIAIDQEGGRVARMEPPVWPAYPPGEVFDRLFELAPSSAIAAARANAQAIGLDLAECGVTMNCLPLLDIRRPGAHDVIGDRALGSDPLRVAALGRAILDGLAEAGVVGVIKHIPGHGRAGADSHKELPTVIASAEELEEDLRPFAALNHAPAGMTAHVCYTAWDADNPATQSPFVIQEIIRRRIGFDGLLISDDLDMEALTGSVPERARRAIAAGCDLALYCWAKLDDMTGIAETQPAMESASLARLKRAMDGSRIGEPATERHAALIETRDRLLALA